MLVVYSEDVVEVDQESPLVADSEGVFEVG